MLPKETGLKKSLLMLTIQIYDGNAYKLKKTAYIFQWCVREGEFKEVLIQFVNSFCNTSVLCDAG